MPLGAPKREARRDGSAGEARLRRPATEELGCGWVRRNGPSGRK